MPGPVPGRGGVRQAVLRAGLGRRLNLAPTGLSRTPSRTFAQGRTCEPSRDFIEFSLATLTKSEQTYIRRKSRLKKVRKISTRRVPPQ
jgi:hypothetical protein